MKLQILGYETGTGLGTGFYTGQGTGFNVLWGWFGNWSLHIIDHD